MTQFSYTPPSFCRERPAGSNMVEYTRHVWRPQELSAAREVWYCEVCRAVARHEFEAAPARPEGATQA